MPPKSSRRYTNSSAKHRGGLLEEDRWNIMGGRGGEQTKLQYEERIEKSPGAPVSTVTVQPHQNKNVSRSNDDAEDACPIFFLGEEEVWNIKRTIEMIYSHPHIYSTNNNDARNSTPLASGQDEDDFNNHPSDQNLHLEDHAIRSNAANENKRQASFPQDQDLLLQEQPPPPCQQSSTKKAVVVRKVSKYDEQWIQRFEELKVIYQKHKNMKYDVYLGKGSGIEQLHGNRIYRKVITGNKERYKIAKGHRLKYDVAKSIIEKFLEQGGTFYCKCEVNYRWVIAPAVVVVQKVKQALREKQKIRTATAAVIQEKRQLSLNLRT